MCYKKFQTDSQKRTGGLLNSDIEEVYLFYFTGSLEKTTKYNSGGNKANSFNLVSGVISKFHLCDELLL